MFFKYCSSCAKGGDAVSVSVATYKVDVNSALRDNSKKSSSSTIPTVASIDNDSNKRSS